MTRYASSFGLPVGECGWHAACVALDSVDDLDRDRYGEHGRGSREHSLVAHARIVTSRSFQAEVAGDTFSSPTRAS